MATPTFTILPPAGRGGSPVYGYLVILGTSPIALPVPDPTVNGRWSQVIYINQSPGSTPAGITLGDSGVGTHGGLSLPVGQPFTDVSTGGGGWYAVASAAGTPLLMLVRG